MSIFKRIGDLVRSNVNDALDKAEDPRKVLEQTIIDMQGEHQKAKQLLLSTITLQKQTEKQAATYREQATSWESKAFAAVKSGSDELARAALAEKQKADGLAEEATRGVESQRVQTDDLKSQLKLLEEKIEEAKKRKDTLIARLNAADMTKKQAAMRAGTSAETNAVGDTSSFDTFERMVGKIENVEAEVEARRELMGNTPELDLELRKKLDAASADDALAALKAKLATGSTAAAAPAAPPDAKAVNIEDELAALKAKLGG